MENITKEIKNDQSNSAIDNLNFLVNVGAVVMSEKKEKYLCEKFKCNKSGLAQLLGGSTLVVPDGEKLLSTE